MTSPAERYAAARRRAAVDAEFPQLAQFAPELGFGMDPFQREACQALERGSGVLVCAPTGAGKTVVGEFAVHLALAQDRKCFYTTPIKALSNQKFNDLVDRYGPAKVGLLTGDNAINGDAPIVVMTTEVLRNMLYAGSTALRDLGYVVMDEVHYLADRFRGAVWEEVIIHLPQSVSLVSLSATVSNAEEFADWLVTVRGKTEVVVSEERPVPLWQHMLAGRRMFDLFHNAEAAQMHEVHPELLRYTRELARRAELTGAARGGPRGRGARNKGPNRPEIVERLDREGLLPAIVFIFSRAGCAAAVQQCLHAGLRLTTPEERTEIRHVVESRTANIPGEDLSVLGYYEWLDGLERGLAAHHAGMLPVFKEVVEELFVRGLVKAVFATETLALGINMPARCVVLERLVKFNGEAHVDLTPGEYTQLTGRAGRRGIDIEGHAVVIWSPEIDPRQVAGLASTRTYPLRSSFRPSYNMAVNLVGSVGRAAARELLESSFAQFQADRSVVGLARQVARNEETMRVYELEMGCDDGDFSEYFDLRVRIAEREKAAARNSAASRRAAALDSLSRLKVGDVIRVPSGRRSGLAVVLDPGVGGFGEPRPLVLTEDRWAGRLGGGEFTSAVEAIARLRVPKHFNHRSPQERRDLAASLRQVALPPGQARSGRTRTRGGGSGDDAELLDLRRALRKHPCHACPEREDHARWAERRSRLARDTDALRQKVANRTGSLARTFDRVCEVLQERGYLAGGTVTEHGRTLSRIWTEADLLVAECLRQGVWDGLAPAELAAAVSVVIFEARREVDERIMLPRGPVADAVDATVSLWTSLEADESGRGLTPTREPDLGFVWPIYRWARGEALSKVLASGPDLEMPAGDFVRWARQVLDLLGQIAEAAGAESTLRTTARAAMDALNRGVLSYTSVL
ncbi:DEAD/DEAH box helicase [Luedemannella flava]|uniref:DEAD/DEAH box helicase n=1 Tax=Luedemannella flava TaxID=349316 RepID=A0ABP4XZH6_9ACTN